MRILFITTFNKEIFIASGRELVKSFFNTQTNNDLLCCYEEINSEKGFRELPQNRLKIFDLQTSNFLHKWLEENRHVIPKEYGGTATQSNKPQAFLKWNFRTAGWFRKIVSFDYALQFSEDYDAFVFVDSDSRFLKNIPDSTFQQVFNKHDYFYHWGKERKKKDLGVESGFIGFKTNERGLKTLKYWIGKYHGQEFQRYMRWDDGGMFCNVLWELNYEGGNDLVEDYRENGKSQSHVIERGIFASYVIHDKGLHQRLGMFNGKK